MFQNLTDSNEMLQKHSEDLQAKLEEAIQQMDRTTEDYIKLKVSQGSRSKMQRYKIVSPVKTKENKIDSSKNCSWLYGRKNVISHSKIKTVSHVKTRENILPCHQQKLLLVMG
jgi:low affinity Fe/Cu permease